jgi:glucosyl-dolichyl phosphate glucuronosyltransferase
MMNTPGQPVPAESEFEFSLVISSKDRVDDLVLTLKTALAALGAATRSWEVLVIDNASSDGTGRQAGDLLGDRGRVVREEQLGLSHARNRALAEARGEVLVYIDDDITTSPGWVRAIEARFDQKDLVAMGGPVRTIFPPGSDQGYVAAAMADGGAGTGDYQPGGPAREVQGNLGYPRGGNMAILRRALFELGGFDHELGWGKRQVPGEETDLFNRMLANGGRIWFDPDAGVDHRLQADKVSWDYLRGWHRGYGRASVLMKSRRGLSRAILKVLDQCWQWTCYSIIAALRGKRSTARPWRKKWQAEGRLAQLFGLG